MVKEAASKAVSDTASRIVYESALFVMIEAASQMVKVRIML